MVLVVVLIVILIILVAVLISILIVVLLVIHNKTSVLFVRITAMLVCPQP